MLTRGQWECAARFAGVVVEFEDDKPVRKELFRGCDSMANYYPWQPLTDWSDFGPLLVLLLRWEAQFFQYSARDRFELFLPHTMALDFRIAIEKAFWNFRQSLISGAKQELIQAGCELAAAIGATMKQEGK